MTNPSISTTMVVQGAGRNVALYPWFKAFQSLTFSQAVWFLYFQETLSGAEAVLLYAIFDLATSILEVPSGYISDRFGRRPSLIFATGCSCIGAMLLGLGDSFAIFVLAQLLIGAGAAFVSGTDNAFLYEALTAAGREDEVEVQELRAWRFGFIALALSAAIGGAIAMFSLNLTFIFSAAMMAVALAITILFREPPRSIAHTADPGVVPTLVTLRSALQNPVLMWIFALSIMMYIFSHIPYVFGQAFILSALDEVGLGDQAPVTSGLITTSMMLLSILASLFALKLRIFLGLSKMLLFAFGLQILLSCVLAASNAPIIIVVLLLRMVPDAFSRPFIIARIQPMLGDRSRATYLSLQSLLGRLMFAGSLYWATKSAGNVGQMDHTQLQFIFGPYAIAGFISLVALAASSRYLRIEN